MLPLEKRSTALPVAATSSTISSSGRMGDDLPCSAALPRPPGGACDGTREEAALSRLQHKWPPEFADGVRCGFLQKHDGARDPAGYPQGFGQWQLERRNAWFAGFNVGFHDRQRLPQRGAAL
jgi:hypothetical protein